VVANELAAWIVTVHMIVALVIVQLLLYATVRTWKGLGGPPSALVIVLILATMVQIGLGTQVRGAVDVALENGTPRSSALGSVGLLDHLHRSAALLVFAGALFVLLFIKKSWPMERLKIRWAWVVAGLAAIQIAFGVAMAYVSLEPAIQVGHLTVASLLLGAESVLLWLGQPERAIP
jgi:cytochrome c oxidase assembly protein subunit 15